MRHGLDVVPVQPASALTVMVVGLKVIFCNVPDCWAPTVAAMVKPWRTKLAMGTVVVVTPEESVDVCSGADCTAYLSPLAQSGTQNSISNACAGSESADSETRLRRYQPTLRIFVLRSSCLALRNQRRNRHRWNRHRRNRHRWNRHRWNRYRWNRHRR